MLFLNSERFIILIDRKGIRYYHAKIRIVGISLLSAIEFSSEETAFKAIPQGHYRANAKLAIKKMCQLSISSY